MEMTEFDALAGPAQRKLAAMNAEYDLGLVAGVTATAELLLRRGAVQDALDALDRYHDLRASR
ncbi:hypothetical protein [Dactylosporangium sp. NPDC005555]|uniref:hypothetical protein n=1 Tax=Dactylosporangium sp. NPDC005555 TaxID=3154889 RepID=UPI0033AB438B